MKNMIVALMALLVVTPVFADRKEMSREEYKEKYHQKIQERMKNLDTNGDGMISKDEHMKHAMEKAEERFKKMDTNNDGQIDKAEREAVHEKIQKFREKRHQKR